MGYKTVLVHIDDTRRTPERVRIAAQLALAEGAHVIGAAMTGVSRFVYQTGGVEDNDPNLAIHLNRLRERATSAALTAEAIIRKSGATSFEKRVVDDEASAGIVLQARYSDLVVVGQTDLNEPSPSALPDFPEYVVLNAGRPVLIVPHTGQFERIGARVLVGWDGSREATRAVTDAIPLLRRADLVQVAIFNPGNGDGERAGADIALYLARHGIKIETIEQATDINIGEALLSLAANQSSDLLVMGGYGHSRFREMVLDGVTRTILASMTLPVLMSH